MSNNQKFKIFAIFICISALGMGAGFYTARYYVEAKPVQIEGLFWPNPKQLVPFDTIDQHGRPFSVDRLQGKWSFIFFGYTNCPDVCPLTLTALNQAYEELGNDKETSNVQMIFVTLDPERDTQQQLADYLSYFNEQMIGLGGSAQQIEGLTKQIGVMSIKREGSTTENYSVDHTASVFLVGPQARLLSVFSAPHTVEAIIPRYKQIRDFIN